MMFRNLFVAVLLTSAMGASAATSTGVSGKPVSALSQSFEAKGQAALAKGQPTAAIDAFETALAVDPANANAYIGIARAYEAQGLTGKAVRYWGDALQLDPNDIAALEGQGLALVARGANARANVNLQRIKTLCKTDCAAATRLQTAMTEAAAKAAKAPVTASAEPAKPAAAKN
ncbi:tetratricopeptide repeat protein [Polymorphobacter arshaanensis]|uniref:Tetratricopeptide repeat protein n=1 Tax=Glacieibacterium arshaanense TaxID=2511025 RepID=A0A4Y9ENU9_9SPHN|nr:tetratricopeptide repeat protein [Polymorphobacter arshaanensis]TFU03728.1 tetratricopeptide repeat protein [Polymorphobacter arshaanensis]